MMSGFCLFDNDLPCEVEYGGETYPINSDFRDWMRFEILMLDKDVPDRVKPMLANRLIFPAVPPADTTKFLLWFYNPFSGGKEQKKKTNRKNQPYSFEHDEALIFAAFMQCYHIDLCIVKMHWWKFRALFDSLPDETKLRKVMGYRVMDIDEKKMGAERARYFRELKDHYRLPRSLSEQQKIDEMKRILANRKAQDNT